MNREEEVGSREKGRWGKKVENGKWKMSSKSQVNEKMGKWEDEEMSECEYPNNKYTNIQITNKENNELQRK